MRSSYALTVGIVSIMLASFGCAGFSPKHESTLAPGLGHYPGPAKVMMVPINETTEVPAGLEVADDRLESLLDDDLRSKGISIERSETVVYRRASRVATKRARLDASSRETGTVSEALHYGDPISRLLEELDVDADIVIVPNVVMRSGDATGGRSCKWDDVRRYETGNVHLDITGRFPVASLCVVVYKNDGSRVFSGYGGLDTVFEISVGRRGMFLRDDLLENERHLKQGICIAKFSKYACSHWNSCALAGDAAFRSS